MNELEKRSDQAGNLRTRMIDNYKEVHGDYPPRSELHNAIVKKKQRKMKHPVITVLALIFIIILIAILCLSIYYFNNNNVNKALLGSKQSSGDETVYISNGQSDEKETYSTAPEESDDQTSAEETVDETEASASDRKTSETGAEEKVETEESQDTQGTQDIKNTQNIKDTRDTIIQKKQETDAKEHEENVTDSTQSKATEYREIKAHKVAAGETLFKIAMQYYKNRSGEEIIRQYNGLEANNIYEGQILKIPLK